MDNNELNKSISRGSSAANSFKTFVFTLSICLILFSGIYYAMSSFGNSEKVFESSVDDKVSLIQEPSEEVQGVQDAPSIFGELAQKDPGVQSKSVLAGAYGSEEETKESTTSVPETGIISITAGLVFALVLFVSGMVIISSNPRKLALYTFENKVTKE